MAKRRVVDLSIEELADLAAKAGREAVAESRRLGLPITGTKDGKIVTTYPGGREVVLKDLPGRGEAMKKRRITDLSRKERSELFAQAGREAVEESRRLGLPITGTKDGRIVTTYPDGREEVLKDLAKPKG